MSEALRSRFEQAVAAHRAGDLRSAEAGYREVIAHAPHLVFAHRNLVTLLKAQDRPADLAAASEALMRAQAPEAALAKALRLLTEGRYAEAWPLYEQRPYLQQDRLPGVPVWRGEPLDGKRLVILQEQGFGDQIMVSRYVPLLPCDVTFACLPPLRRLLSRVCQTVDREAVGSDYDYWVSSMSLPARFGTTLSLVPPSILTEPPSPGSGVGIVTAGASINPNDANRSIPREVAQPLYDLPGTISLQPEDTGAKDFEDTADIIRGLELVISADTAVAHLAASMGKPTWIMLPQVGDWRWMPGQERNAWYPEARLFWQEAPGDWRGVVERVLEAYASPVP